MLCEAQTGDSVVPWILAFQPLAVEPAFLEEESRPLESVEYNFESEVELGTEEPLAVETAGSFDESDKSAHGSWAFEEFGKLVVASMATNFETSSALEQLDYLPPRTAEQNEVNYDSSLLVPLDRHWLLRCHQFDIEPRFPAIPERLKDCRQSLRLRLRASVFDSWESLEERSVRSSLTVRMPA